MHDLPILERSILQDYSGGDPETETMIIRIFKDNLQADMNALQTALDAGDYPDWSAIAHKIYGGCANFGAKRVAALCDAAQDTPIERTQQIQQLHTHIIEQCHAVLRELSTAP